MFGEFSCKTTRESLAVFNSSLDNGLSTKQVEEAIKKWGPNAFSVNETRWWHLLLRQFKSAFVYLLIVAATIAFFLGELLDSGMITLFIVINTVLGFYQEYRSEKTLKLLKKYIVKKSTVIRNGDRQIINSTELVPGDVVVLETGDIAPVDIRVLEENDLYLDESTLTGEAIQVKKSTSPIEAKDIPIYKAENIVFAGTTVIEGKLTGIVFATGKNTQLGQITKLTVETKTTSGFEKQINKFSKFILYLTVITLVLVFAVHLLFKQNSNSPFDLIIFSIALAVGVIPEALPLVATFSLSQGGHRLAKKNVVVKRLSAIEDLGSIQILCSDKTGTLTENALSISEINSTDKEKTLLYGFLASSYVKEEKLPNNAFDLAIVKKIDSPAKQKSTEIKRLFEIPFNPARKRNSVLVDIHGKKHMIVRGAHEAIMPFVTDVSKEYAAELVNWILKEGMAGKRVLAVAYKLFEKESYLPEDEATNLGFLGLISFVDPVKESTCAAVKKAEKLGVKLKIITGDGPEVAGAVACEVGIVISPQEVLTGDDLDRLPALKQLEAVEKFNVFARISPEQKYKIIGLLQENYEVGYLGEGINDAPALKLANVAIVVDGASDVAREASDIVLLKHNLKVIVDGIEEGRKTFVNTTKYIKSTLASNFGNFYAMVFASFVIDFLPMLPVQILLVNLLSDFPMISIATDTVEDSELKNPHTYDVKEITLSATVLGVVSTIFDFITFGIFYRLGASVLRTNWFMTSILTELLLIYSVRTKKIFCLTKKPPSVSLLILTIVAGVLTIFIPYSSIGARIFGFLRPSWSHTALIFGIVAAYLFSTETVKWLYYKFVSGNGKNHINAVKTLY